MNKRNIAMLAIVAATLILGSYWQSVVGLTTRPNVWLAYGIWLALDLVAIWAIFSIGRMKPNEPKSSPLQFGWLLMFLLGASALSAVASRAIAEAMALFQPVVHTQFEAARELHVYKPGRSFLPNFWPIFVAPIVEEIIFRVGILGGFMRFMRKPWAIVLSSLVFALVHGDIYAPVAVVGTFIAGLVLSTTYLMFGLRAAILLHFLHNTDNFYRPPADSSEYILMAYVLTMLAAILVFIYQLIRNRKLVFR